MLGIAILLIAILLLVGLAKCIRVNQEYQRSVIFRIGRFNREQGAGIYLMLPFIETAMKVDIRTITTSFDAQEMVTKDGLAVKLDAVAWYQVTDPRAALINAANWQYTLVQAAETTIRDVVGRHRLEDLLRDRSNINQEMLGILAETTKWGATVQKIEIKNLDLPEGMQRAMAREAEAHREKAARIIKAEGEFEASKKLKAAADIMRGDPVALQLRSLQTISEVGAEKNSVIVMALPLEAITDGTTAAALTAAAAARLQTT